MLCLERDAWSMVTRLRQARNEYAAPPPPAWPLSSLVDINIPWSGEIVGFAVTDRTHNLDRDKEVLLRFGLIDGSPEE